MQHIGRIIDKNCPQRSQRREPVSRANCQCGENPEAIPPDVNLKFASVQDRETPTNSA